MRQSVPPFRPCWVGRLAIVAALLAQGCGEPNDLCLTEPTYGITLLVRDSVTTIGAAAGARATARDGPTFVVLYRLPFDSLQFRGVGDAGSYDVVVTKPGYRTWARSDVRVVRGPCGVGCSTIDVLLQPQS